MAALPLTGVYAPELARLDTILQTWADANHIQAATLAVVRDKRLVYERGYGYQDSARTQPILPDAKMRLATNSTPMTRRALQSLIAERALTPGTNVEQYLYANLELKFPTKTDAQLSKITVADIYSYSTCTNEASPNEAIGVPGPKAWPGTSTERLRWVWTHPKTASFGGPVTRSGGCVVGVPNSPNNGFSHFSHEIAAEVIAIAAWIRAGRPNTYRPTNDTCPDCIGYWYGHYIQHDVGEKIGATLLQAQNQAKNAYPNEIWYDSAGQVDCPRWNYWVCQSRNPPTQAKVPLAYSIDFFARPGSGTVVASARDVARFWIYYDGARDASTRSNNLSEYSPAWATEGDLPGTYTKIDDLVVGNHPIAWVLLANRNPGGIKDPVNAINGALQHVTSWPARDLFVDK
jgi:CubicO group peptidase (beta-lactamase class C family)